MRADLGRVSLFEGIQYILPGGGDKLGNGCPGWGVLRIIDGEKQDVDIGFAGGTLGGVMSVRDSCGRLHCSQHSERSSDRKTCETERTMIGFAGRREGKRVTNVSL